MKKRTIIYIGVLALVLLGGVFGMDPISGLINAYITELKFTFELDSSKLEPGKVMPWPGTGALYVNGEKQDELYFPTTHISTYSLAETFDVGIDTGTQVDPDYQGNPFGFTGELDCVIITLTD